MINSSLKEKYWDSATDKQMVISVVGTNQKIDNSMLEIGTFSLEESLCSESELKFGACEANCVKFTARNAAGSIIGKTISIEETIDGDSENPMPYGVFKVASDVPTADRTKRQITAYDAMYDIINTDVKSWYAGLSFPMTLKQFRDSFFAHLGIAQVETNLVNDSMTVNKTIVATQTDDSSAVTEESSISGKTVVTAICEINGCFGNINREGKFEYVFLEEITSALYPREDLFPADDLFPIDANTESMTGHYITFDYEDFQSKAITQLEIKTSNDNAGAIVGTAGNNYSITGNFLVSDKTGAELEQIANNLLPIMKQAAYTPIKSCTCVGNPCLTLGEPIRFNTTREIVETYILQRTLTGVQSKRDSISAQGTQTHSAKVNSIRDTIESVQKRTSKLERNADHLQSTYENLEDKTSSKFEQTADAITAEVTRATDAEGELQSNITQTADAITAEVTRAQNAESSLASSITQTAESITAEVSKKVGNNEVRSKFAMSSENVTIESGSINFNSNTIGIDSANFGLDPDTGETTFYGAQTFYDDKSMSNSGIFGYGYVDGMSSPLGFYFSHNLYVDGNKIALKRDIPDMSNYVTSSALNNKLTNYINNLDAYADSDKGTTFYYSLQHNGHTLAARRRAINTSDERLKVDLLPLDDLTDIYMSFEPISYHFNPGLAGYEKELQYGLSAQKVEKAFKDHGIMDNALVWKVVPDKDFHEDVYTGGDLVYHLDKDQLHAMHIQMIQKQQKEIELLKQKNEDLERRLSALEGK